MQSQQKGKIEIAHEYIRRYIPKGTYFNDISQEKLTLISNHINSVPRDKMFGMNAFKVQKCFCPEKFFKKLGFYEIEPSEIIFQDYLIKWTQPNIKMLCRNRTSYKF